MMSRLMLVLVACAALSGVAMAGPKPEPAVISMALAKGVSPQDAIQSMQLRANSLNIKQVGDLPLSKQVTAMTGKATPLIHIFLFCNPLTAADIAGFNPEFAAYMPCRIALVQDKPGHYELVMINLDPLIRQIPAKSKLHAEAEKVKDTLLSIMQWGAEGRI